MSAPSGHVAGTATFLVSGWGTAKEKLIIGIKMLSAALVLSGDWTPDLRAKANGLKAALLRGNRLEKTVDEMTENVAGECLRQLTSDVVRLAAEIEPIRAEKRLASRSVSKSVVV